MSESHDHHATIFLPPEVAAPIEAVRREWDPLMAGRIAAHITLVYPEEAPQADVLIERLRAAAPAIEPFRLRLGRVECLESPEGGVYVAVEDLDGGYRALREAVLRPPFHATAFPPHVTLVHRLTSTRGRELWERGPHSSPDRVFSVPEVAITVFEVTRWIAPFRFALGRPPSPARALGRRGPRGDA